MSNIRIILITFLFFLNSCHSQDCITNDLNTYLTYTEKDLPSHQLILCKNEIKLKVLSHGLLYGGIYNFSLKKNKDIYRLELIVDTSNQGGINVKDNYIDSIIEQFDNVEIKIISEKKILLLKQNRPYHQKKIVDSVLGNNRVYLINNKLYRTPHDIKDTSELYKLIRKPKKAEVKVLNGKEAYEKFGIIGFEGIIEINNGS